MVWDTIYGRGAEAEPAEEWGGISYALAALDAALPDDWSIVPLVKVGSDLAPRANEFLNDLTRRAGTCRFIESPDPTNRVTLHYNDLHRCTEHLSGGVSAWTWLFQIPACPHEDSHLGQRPPQYPRINHRYRKV